MLSLYIVAQNDLSNRDHLMKPLELEVFSCRSDNYGVLVHDPESGLTASIDAPEEQPILDAAARRGWKLTHIFTTHHHGDHVEANLALKEKFGLEIIGPVNEAVAIPGLDRTMADGDEFHFGEHAVRVIETPGHTAGHYSMMVELANRRPMLFTADACYSQKNMDMMCISSFHLDPVGSLNSMKRLKALAEKHDAELFYSHDLESFKKYQTGPAFYS